MARLESKDLPIEPKHHTAILSLVQATSSEHKLLEPFAGEGEFLEVAAKYWKMTHYANELDSD